jgi:hypothetical protein
MRARLQKLPREPQPEQQVEQPVPIGDPPTAEQIWQMIAEAAYYRAEKRGFAPGLETEDWRDAEAEVMQRLRAAQSRI